LENEIAATTGPKDVLPWSPVEAALSIFNASLFREINFFDKKLIKSGTAMNAKS
jgi:hypothetical protein